MRRLERTDAVGSPMLRAADASDPNSYKVRRGVVGGHAELFETEDIAYVNELVTRELDPYFGYLGEPTRCRPPAAVSKRRLDIGCGVHKTPGAVGLDWAGNTDADILCDLTKFPWPLKDGSFDEIFAYNFMEHLPNIVATMEEIHRVGRPGAVLHIKTGHFAALESWEDPTHYHHFGYESFDYFCRSCHASHYTPCEFRILGKKLHFGGHPMSLIGRFLHWRSPRKYDKRWAFIFRPSTLEVNLAVVKSPQNTVVEKTPAGASRNLEESSLSLAMAGSSL
jgi:SAM-dependent methyltransferase